AEIEALADVDEGRHSRVQRAERAGDDGADVRRGYGLGRCVSGVPLILMARVKNETEVPGRVTANQGSAVHHARNFFQPGGEFDVIDSGINRRESAAQLGGFHAALEWRVVFRIERFRVRHAAGQPEYD